MLKPMVIWTLAVDSSTNSPIVILKEIDGERTLPIWIGLLEATVIATEMQGIKFARPLTHDLLKNIIELIDVKVKKVEICDLKEDTYYALIHFNYNGREIALDARPSDALALALRVNAPIFAVEEVIQNARQVQIRKVPKDQPEQEKKWKEILEDLNPEDFGKYKM